MMKSLLAVLFSFLIISSSCGQVNSPITISDPGNKSPVGHIAKPIKWSSSSKELGNGVFEIKITGDIQDGWHTYSKDLSKDVTPLPGSVTFTPSKDYKLEGGYKESGNRIETDEPVLKEHYIEYIHQIILIQKVKISSPSTTVKGSVDYQICNDKTCLPPDPFEFSVFLLSSKPQDNNKSVRDSAKSVITPVDTSNAQAVSAPPAASDKKKTPTSETVIEVANGTATKSLWRIFLLGLGYGLLALIQPCVFPVIPLTVSFFLKRSENKIKGRVNALTYAASILIIFVVFGFVISLIFGSNALNEWSSSWIFNLLFFLLLNLFALSFFGVFEITLPSSWVNKTESVADKGGLIGIFFMAFSLVLISFSCTLPIIGNLLPLITQGDYTRPLVGMAAFGLALAIPFGFFAFFPSYLHSLPKSGGWMNTVKVTMGFIEIALSLIYFSKADLAYHWRILDRDIFLSLWIVIFILLGFYLIGRIRFAHDSEVHYVSIPRLFFAILSFSFALYMVPGLWGAPLKAISAFSPPQFTLDFDLTRLSVSEGNTPSSSPKKFDKLFETPLGIDGYYDYKEGSGAAKRMGKPVMINFTGKTCVNCRKMEASVWSDPQVLKRLKNDYVLISMYADDKLTLPDSLQYVSTFSSKKITTFGNWYSDIEASMYKTNTQPLYVLLDNEGKLLNAPRSYDQDITAYISWLDEGLAAYKKRDPIK